MTQQPMYPGQPYLPQQGYGQAPVPMQQPQYGQQPMAPYQAAPVQQFPPQGYGQQPQAPAPPPAQAGTIDDYYNQPVAAGGPGISWKNKAEGTAYWGVISGAPTVQQDTDYNTKMPLFQRDGVTPKWVMLIPLSGVQTNHQGTPEFPDGEVVFYARGKDKDELNRAIAEAGCSGAPQVGATFVVQLVQRKPNRTGNPTNVVRITYTPPNGQPHQASQPAAPAQQQEQAPAPQPSAPVQQPQIPQQVGQPVQGGPPQWAQPQQPQVTGVVPQAEPQQIPAPQAQQVPTGVPQAVPSQAAPAAAPAPQPPAGMAPEQQAVLAQLGIGQAQA